MTECSACDVGSYQHASGQSGCRKCSEMLNADGQNPHLWTTTMMTEDTGGWQERSGSHSRCGEGDWVDAFSHCREWRRDPVEGMGDEGGFLVVLNGIVLARLVVSPVSCNVIVAVSLSPLKLHTPNLHTSNQSQLTRTMYSVTSFGSVTAAISVLSNNAFSRSESRRRRRCKSSAGSPYTHAVHQELSSECVNSRMTLCRCVFHFEYTLIWFHCSQ